MEYTAPEMFEIDARLIGVCCACAADDSNPYRTVAMLY